MSEKYNGWTNYATWRINLEIFDGMDASDFHVGKLPAFEFSGILKDYVDEILCSGSSVGSYSEGLTLNYARAFVDQVNFYEIAEHLLDNVEQDEEESEE